MLQQLKWGGLLSGGRKSHRGKVSRMNLENVQRISAASESACIAVLQKPEDAGARKRLFVANRRHPRMIPTS
jgi:hypothetical protein